MIVAVLTIGTLVVGFIAKTARRIAAAEEAEEAARLSAQADA